MKNIQIIDDADNCTYSIFQATDDEFAEIFTKPDQDIVFSEEIRRSKRVGEIFNLIWTRPILKKDAMGIHGTIFYHSAHRRKYYPKSRRMIDMDENAINDHERLLFAAERQRLDNSVD
jgi:hypothetical protein